MNKSYTETKLEKKLSKISTANMINLGTSENLVSKGIIQKKRKKKSTKKVLKMLIKEAKLTHDTEFFKKMDPYVEIHYLDQFNKT